MTKYSIFWKNTETGCEGNGTHAFDELSDVLEWVKYLNDKYPDIYHYYKVVSSDTPLINII
tara:strand:+ start:602 stop:784 length:183 start_codon:yes stop_codon:yes gene_type:complete